LNNFRLIFNDEELEIAKTQMLYKAQFLGRKDFIYDKIDTSVFLIPKESLLELAYKEF